MTATKWYLIKGTIGCQLRRPRPVFTLDHGDFSVRRLTKGPMTTPAIIATADERVGKQTNSLHAVRGACMSHPWNTTTLTTEAEASDLLTELRGKRWLCRGQSSAMIASSRRSTANHEKASRGLKSSRSSVKASISFGQQPASLPIREKKAFWPTTWLH